jgi:hypothetical protein
MSTNTQRPETRSVLSALGHFYSGTSTYLLVHARATIRFTGATSNIPSPRLSA